MNRRGHVRLRRRTVATVALAAGAAVALATPAVAAPASGELSQPFAAGNTQTVTLITGDHVIVSTAAGGATNYAIQPTPGNSGFESFQASNGDRYVVPVIAIPYLNQLDRSLFDVSALARAGITAATPLPVQLSFPAGVTPTAPAGVTLTSVTGSTATGYLTSASAPAFGALLHHQIGADVAAGRKAGATALPAGISLAGAVRGGGVTPNYPLHILTINTLDSTGQPTDNINVILMNTDSVRKVLTGVPIAGGIGKIAVPAGNYAALGFAADFDANGNATALRQITVTGFVVPDSGTTPTLAVDERTATSKITATSAKPANASLLSTTVALLDATGVGFATGLTNLDAAHVPVYVSPTAKPATGALHYVVQWTGDAPNAADNYRVDLAFAAEGVPADESFVGKADQLATVKEITYSDPAAGSTPASLLNGPVDPVLLALGFSAMGESVPTPGVFTEYLGTADGGEWVQSEITATQIMLQAGPRTFHAGRTVWDAWGKGPLAAGLGQYQGMQFCDACTADGNIGLAVPMFRDTAPDRTGFPFRPVKVHFTLYQGDTVLFDHDNYYGAAVPIPQTPATFRGVLDLDQTGATGVSQAIKTHTEETVKYDPTATSTPLPTSDACPGQTATTPCEVLGAMTVGYQFHGVDLTNTSHSPFQVLGLNVGHVAYSGIGSRSPVTSVTVAVSFDNGTTWRQVPVFGFHGEYTAVWPNRDSAVGTSPSLKVTAMDAAGDAISQTITNAYTVGKSGGNQ